jgi:hypothetical protein
MGQPRRHFLPAESSAISERIANDAGDDSRLWGFDWMRMAQRTPDVSAGADRLSLLAGLTAGLAYSTLASFVANVLTPVSGYLVETNPLRRAVSGRYQEVFSMNGVASTVLVSLIVFALVWWTTRVILEHWQSDDWRGIGAADRRPSGRDLLEPRILAPLASAVDK